MKACRVVLAPNETDFTADLHSSRPAPRPSRSPATTGPTAAAGSMDTTRFTQFGRWHGWIEYDGQRMEIDRTETYGTKDRSWGVRPVAGGDNGALRRHRGPWGCSSCGRRCTGTTCAATTSCSRTPWAAPGSTWAPFLPAYDSLADNPGVEDPGVEPMHRLEHQLEFEPGSRMIKSAALAMTSLEDDTRHEITFEKQFTYRMKGIATATPPGPTAPGRASWPWNQSAGSWPTSTRPPSRTSTSST